MNTTRNSYPLSWPPGWKRHSYRDNPRFARRTIDDAVSEILRQLKLLGVRDWEVIISANLVLRNDGLPKSGQSNPADSGVAVYFKLKNQDRVLATDKWINVADNLHAIARHIDSTRAQERWGVGNIAQAFAGYTALMSGREIRDWWLVLGVQAHTPTDVVITARNALAKQHHPDNGGSVDKMSELNEAFTAFKKERNLP